MSRKARQQSGSGFFHVIVRGIGKQILFEEKSDYLYFLSVLKKCANDNTVKVCAYCIMDNHVHLLLSDQNYALALFMKKIGVSYATYYNKKYQRTGHVFQDRFKSEPIENNAQLLIVFRYILKNPEKAGICRADRYEWSSFRYYGLKSTFIDTEILVNLLGNVENYRAFISEPDNDHCAEYLPARMTDEYAIDIIKGMGLENGTIIQSYPKEKRDSAIMELLLKGLSIRQIERLTGISRGIIQRAGNKSKDTNTSREKQQ